MTLGCPSHADLARARAQVRDLHRARLKESARPGLSRQRSADEVRSATSARSREHLLHPDVGLASEMAQPGGFRRAHVLEKSNSGNSADVRLADALTCAAGEASPPSPASRQASYASSPLDAFNTERSK